MSDLRLILATGLVTLAGCGGGTPTQPTPEPSPTSTLAHPVDLILFYDENANGLADATEGGRVPGVLLHLGGVSARSERQTGAAHLEAVPDGSQLPEAVEAPPYYEPGTWPRISVPAAAPVALPLTLDIGSNRPNVYMAFGDSITEGMGSASGAGYRDLLAARLRSHYGVAKVVNEGVGGTRTARGRERLGGCLANDLPAYTLVLYGTNDWNDAACKYDGACPTVDNLQAIIRHIQATDSLPIVGTIPPANPERSLASRNEWVARTNETLRTMIRAEGAVVADIHRAFLAEPSLPPLFYDHVHPNDQGYALIARELFRAVSGDAEAEIETVEPLPDPLAPPAAGDLPFAFAEIE